MPRVRIHNIAVAIAGLSMAGSAALAASPAQAPPAAAPTAAEAAVGTWVNVTPAGVKLTDDPGCGNYGTGSIQADPARPSDLYTEFNCQGIWKSTDYGASWTGPINKGSNGAAVSDCAG